MNATNCIHMSLKLSLSITPIRIGKMHQFFLSGNNFVAEKHTEKTICPITNWGISKPWIKIQPIVTKASLCYWENKVTFRYKYTFHQLFLSPFERSFEKRKEKKSTYIIFVLSLDSAVYFTSCISRRTVKGA